MNINNGWKVTGGQDRFYDAVRYLQARGAPASSAEAAVFAILQAALFGEREDGQPMSSGDLVNWGVTDMVRHGMERNQAGVPTKDEMHQMLAFLRHAQEAAIDVGLICRDIPDRE
jgi:hypothetical protein